jgi:molecular chaperone IbpA
MFDDDFTSFNVPTFPFYNIVKKDKNKYDIELALAGYSKDDIEVGLEEGVLSIKSKKEDTKEESKDGEILHKGIAKRYFSKSFTIADDVKVKGAELKDGLLKVSLERIVPEHKQPRTIDIK